MADYRVTKLPAKKNVHRRSIKRNGTKNARREGVNWLVILPRELRDMIYKYVLTEEGGLVADVSSTINTPVWFRAANTNNKYQASHQLRLTCRQLYAETTTLGIRSNDLTFIDNVRTGGLTAYDHFARFVEDCSRTHVGNIAHITICDEEPRLNFLTLLYKCRWKSPVERFCQKNPKAVVVVQNERAGMEWLASNVFALIKAHGSIDSQISNLMTSGSTRVRSG